MRDSTVSNLPAANDDLPTRSSKLSLASSLSAPLQRIKGYIREHLFGRIPIESIEPNKEILALLKDTSGTKWKRIEITGVRDLREVFNKLAGKDEMPVDLEGKVDVIRLPRDEEISRIFTPERVVLLARHLTKWSREPGIHIVFYDSARSYAFGDNDRGNIVAHFACENEHL